MAIIKNIMADRLLKEAVVLDLGDLKRQADDIMAKAIGEAETLLQDARQEAQRLVGEAEGKGHAEGYERGLMEGREAGREQARTESLDSFQDQYATLQENWNGALLRWENDRQAMLLEAKDDVLTFAFTLARKIVHRVVQQDASVVADQVRESLELLSRPSAVRILVHPEDVATIDDILPQLKETLSTCRHVELKSDDTVSRGGCIVRTEGGRIDATIEMQLQRMAETLLPATSDDWPGMKREDTS